MTSFLSGCAGVSATDTLQPGMTQNQIKAAMGGPPDATEFVNNKVVWKYGLFRAGEGTHPYYLVLSKDLRLESWYENKQEYEQQQQADLQAVGLIQSTTPQTVNVNVHNQ